MMSNFEPGSEAAFQGKVDEWVYALLSEDTTFARLIKALPSVYPSDALASIRRLHRGGKITLLQYKTLEAEVQQEPSFDPSMPIPKSVFLEHPLDYEWRFTNQGVVTIFQEIENLGLAQNSRILCLGCPSVFLLGRKARRNLQFDLWDKNGAKIGQLAEAEGLGSCDIEHGALPATAASATVIDPPWYLDFFRLFTWASLQVIPIGGRILMSFPPRGTRASAKTDFREFEDWCVKNGLQLERRKEGYLPYRSPLFECNALKAEGLTNVPLDWRRGDLLIFRKERVIISERPVAPARRKEWVELRVGHSRIRISTQQASAKTPLEPVASTDVLPSVSSRNCMRPNANVVTSGNRFLKTQSPDLLIECFEKLSSSQKAGFQLKGDGGSLFKAAQALIGKEDNEAANYLRRVHEL
jgi:hypothetical protein